MLWIRLCAAFVSFVCGQRTHQRILLPSQVCVMNIGNRTRSSHQIPTEDKIQVRVHKDAVITAPNSQRQQTQHKISFKSKRGFPLMQWHLSILPSFGNLLSVARHKLRGLAFRGVWLGNLTNFVLVGNCEVYPPRSETDLLDPSAC